MTRNARRSLTLLIAALVAGGAWLLFDGHEADDRDADPPNPEAGSGRPAELQVREPSAEDPSRRGGPAYHGTIREVAAVRVPFGGTVVDGAKAPVPGARVVAARREGWISLETDDEGRFEVEVPAGRYDLSFLKVGVGALYLRRELLDGLSGSGRVYRLEPPATFALRYHDGTAGMPGCRMEIRPWNTVQPDALVFSGVTDADGIVRVPDVFKGLYDVVTHVRAGWVQQREGWNSTVGEETPRDTPVPPGKGGVFRGTVIDEETGAPVVGATVTLILKSYGSGSWLESTARTDAHGAFAFPPITGLVRALYVVANGYARWPNDQFEGREIEKGRTFHPAKVQLFGQYDLLMGVDREFHVALRRGAEVRGVVRDTQGDPIPGVSLRFHPMFADDRMPLDERTAQTGADGAYNVKHLRAMSYSVYTLDAGWFRPRFYSWGTRGMEPPASPVTLDLELQRGRVLRGTVRHGDGEPALGARVWVEGESRLLTVARVLGRVLETYSHPDGKWTLADAPPWPGLSLHAALGPQKAAPLAIDDRSPEDFEFVLAPSGTVQGRVLADGAPVRWRAVVELLPVGEPAHRTRRRATGNGVGVFRLDHVSPGAWRMRAREGTRATAQPATIQVKANETLELELVLQADLTLTGLVVDESGTPLDRARVDLRGHYRTREKSRNRVGESTKTDAEGRFRFTAIRAGDYELSASKARFERARVQKLWGHEKDVRIVLKPR